LSSKIETYIDIEFLFVHNVRLMHMDWSHRHLCTTKKQIY